MTFLFQGVGVRMGSYQLKSSRKQEGRRREIKKCKSKDSKMMSGDEEEGNGCGEGQRVEEEEKATLCWVTSAGPRLQPANFTAD